METTCALKVSMALSRYFWQFVAIFLFRNELTFVLLIASGSKSSTISRKQFEVHTFVVWSGQLHHVLTSPSVPASLKIMDLPLVNAIYRASTDP